MALDWHPSLPGLGDRKACIVRGLARWLALCGAVQAALCGDVFRDSPPRLQGWQPLHARMSALWEMKVT